MADGRKRGHRLTAAQDASTRDRIQTSQIINRLTLFINGKVELVPAQVTAALGLLRKVLPDLNAVEQSGGVTHTYVARMSAPAKTMDEWKVRAEQIAGKTLQ